IMPSTRIQKGSAITANSTADAAGLARLQTLELGRCCGESIDASGSLLVLTFLNFMDSPSAVPSEGSATNNSPNCDAVNSGNSEANNRPASASSPGRRRSRFRRADGGARQSRHGRIVRPARLSSCSSLFWIIDKALRDGVLLKEEKAMRGR